MTFSIRVVFTAFIVALMASPAYADQIEWQEHAIDDALGLAAPDETIIMIDVFATWCGPCHMLDAKTFPDPAVVELSSKTLALKIDGETAIGEEIVERYHVVGYPTILFLQPDGTEIDRIVGFVEPKDFIEIAGGYLEGRGTLDDLERQLEAAPSDKALLQEVFQRHVFRGNELPAMAVAQRLRQAIEVEAGASQAEELASVDFMMAKYLYLRGQKNYVSALAIFEHIERTWPGSVVAKRVEYPKARALLGLERDDEAFATLSKFLDGATDSSPHNTVAWFCYREKARMEWGIEVARRGLELEPESSGLLDTLAELQFATGDVAGAVESIKKAIEIKNDPYYAGQLARFEAALKE